jgi:hypothetical protein
MDLFSLAARLTVDSGSLTSGLRDAVQQGNETSEKLGAIARKIESGLKKAFSVGAILAATKKLSDFLVAVSAAGDKIDKQSQALGMSRKAYQEWEYILGQSGASIDSLGLSMKTIGSLLQGTDKDLEKNDKEFKKLGLSVAQLSALSEEERFGAIVRAFQEMPAGAEKSALALKIFGRNGQDLMALLNSAPGSIEEMQKQMEDLGLIMSDEDVDAAVEFGDAMDRLTRSATVFGQRLGARVLPVITKGMESLAKRIGKVTNAMVKGLDTGDFTEFFSTLLEQIQEMIPEAVDTIISVLVGLLENADKIVDAGVTLAEGLLNGLAKAIPVLVGKIPDILASALQGLANIGISVGNMVIDGINGIFGTRIPHLDKIELPSWSEISGTVTTWWQNDVQPKIEEACQWLLGLFNGGVTVTEKDISEALGKWWGGVKTHLLNVCSWLLGLFNGGEAVTPAEVEARIGKWWSGTVMPMVTQACNWLLGLFTGGKTQVSQADVESTLSGWWGSITGFVTKACTWVLGLFTGGEGSSQQKVSDAIGQWWNGVKEWVTNACTWVLGLFTGGEGVSDNKVREALGNWWNGVKGFVTSACQWVLGLFTGGESVDSAAISAALGKWWEGIKGLVSAACGWVLGLFTGGEEDNITGEKVGSIIGGWWDGIKGFVTRACTWVLGLFTGGEDANVTADKVGSILSGWWSKIKGAIAAACTWVLGLFSGGEGGISLEKVATTLRGWWGSIKDFVKQACTWVIGLFTGGEDTDQSKVSTAISQWWTNVKEWVKGACSWVLGLFTGGDETVSEASVGDILSGWWEKVSGWVTSACKWVLGIFGTPETPTQARIKEILGSWWEHAKVRIAHLTKWSLGLFGIDVSESDVIKVVKQWWGDPVSGIRSAVEAALEWSLKLFDKPSQEDADKSSLGIVSGMIGAVQAGVQWIQDNNVEGILSSILTGFAASAAVSGAIRFFDSLKALITAPNTSGGIGTIVGLIATALMLIIQNWDKIEPILQKAKEALQPVIDFVTDLFGKISQVVDKLRELLGLDKEPAQKGNSLLWGNTNPDLHPVPSDPYSPEGLQFLYTTIHPRRFATKEDFQEGGTLAGWQPDEETLKKWYPNYRKGAEDTGDTGDAEGTVTAEEISDIVRSTLSDFFNQTIPDAGDLGLPHEPENYREFIPLVPQGGSNTGGDNGMLSQFVAAANNLLGQIPGAVSGALSGWGVSMDGAAVGNIVAPTVDSYIGAIVNSGRYL